ncbi:hypothetical protein [Pseudobutyrivibrio sp. MD2005]|uniref:hypothetical protein n=1 Tax=Pseudobutyrivibrio sp. MD2005 TaxID=1410616 RepID=UPI000485E9D7|nr:hypothetical protein [Pseudobutyrivibrio sp. MD2005]
MCMRLTVYKMIEAVLNRITARREFAIITNAEKIDLKYAYEYKEIIFLSDDSGKGKYLYLGDTVLSRACFDKEICLSKILEQYPKLEGQDVIFPTLRELYKIAEGKRIELIFEEENRTIANKKWINKYLQIGTNKDEWYMTDDFSSVNFLFRKITNKNNNSVNIPKIVDPAQFELYDRLTNYFYDMNREWHYGDAFSIEYSIEYAETVYRYFLTYFYSNHNWNADPANIYNICFTAMILPGECKNEDVRFLHPSKITFSRDSGDEYMLECMTMDNDVSIKFTSDGVQAVGDVAGNRIYENPIALIRWMHSFHLEIELT